MKTNLFIHDEGPSFAWRPGFSSPFSPELNVDRRVIRNLRATLEALRRGAGDDIDILVDLNFHAKTEGYLKILRAIQDFDLFWVELDSYSPDALAFIRGQSRFPISSCETLFGGRELLPFLRRQAVDVAIIDTVWNGAWQAMKMADLCDIHEVNVAPHNLWALVHVHERALRGGGAELPHHGNRYRSPGLGRRVVHARAAVPRWTPDRARPAGVGHRTR